MKSRKMVPKNLTDTENRHMDMERGEERGTTEDEMVGWHHRPDGHEFE